MNFSPKVKSWIILICMVISTGGGVTIASIIGGCNKWIAIGSGIVTGTTNVLHALFTSSPNDAKQDTNNKQ